MRTTLDIDEDVLLAAKALGKREHKSAGRVLSELAREALQGSIIKSRGAGESEEFMGFRPLPAGDYIVTSELINKIRDEEGI